MPSGVSAKEPMTPQRLYVLQLDRSCRRCPRTRRWSVFIAARSLHPLPGERDGRYARSRLRGDAELPQVGCRVYVLSSTKSRGIRTTDPFLHQTSADGQGVAVGREGRAVGRKRIAEMTGVSTPRRYFPSQVPKGHGPVQGKRPPTTYRPGENVRARTAPDPVDNALRGCADFSLRTVTVPFDPAEATRISPLSPSREPRATCNSFRASASGGSFSSMLSGVP